MIDPLDEIRDARREQIEAFGHTPEKDAELPLAHFAREIRRRAISVEEDAQFRCERDVARRHLIKLGALVLAAIERLDLERGKTCDL